MRISGRCSQNLNTCWRRIIMQMSYRPREKISISVMRVTIRNECDTDQCDGEKESMQQARWPCSQLRWLVHINVLFQPGTSPEILSSMVTARRKNYYLVQNGLIPETFAKKVRSASSNIVSIIEHWRQVHSLWTNPKQTVPTVSFSPRSVLLCS
jgi:hypothetical protein